MTRLVGWRCPICKTTPCTCPPGPSTTHTAPRSNGVTR